MFWRKAKPDVAEWCLAHREALMRDHGFEPGLLVPAAIMAMSKRRRATMDDLRRIPHADWVAHGLPADFLPVLDAVLAAADPITVMAETETV